MDPRKPIKPLPYQQPTPHDALTSPFPCFRILPKGGSRPCTPSTSILRWVCPHSQRPRELLTWKTVAFKSEVTSLTAGASIDTRRGCTGHIGTVTVLACEALGTLASVGTRNVEAGASMLAASWDVTFIDISFTLLPCDACWAYAGELVGCRGTGAPVCTGMRQTGISPLALLP